MSVRITESEREKALMLFTFAEQISKGARVYTLRTGQYLFNHLPAGVANVVSGTLFDPFQKELSKKQIIDWLDDHLIFDGKEIVGCFNNNTILWEKK